jgi:predicted nicotinamide N-methyase
MPPIVEEDWSHHMAATSDVDLVATRNMYDHREQSFSYYDTVFVPLTSVRRESIRSKPPKNEAQQRQSIVMELRCMESLTPLDMLNLSNGRSDATGNRIWMGAVMFLEYMVREIALPAETTSNRATHNNNSSNNNKNNINIAEALIDLRTKLFHNKKVLELGSGTGAALIAVGMAGATKTRTTSLSPVCPSVMTLTDNDTNILSLCQMNCDRNLRHLQGSPDYTVGRLDWGEFYGDQSNPKHYCATASNCHEDDPFFLNVDGLKGSQDTVIATDVIYDVATIPMLFAIAEGLLGEGGFFVLAHVPRASIECEPSRIRESLEKTIVSEARKNGFETTLRERKGLENWEILLGGDKHKNHGIEEIFHGDEDSSDGTAILRPSTLAQLWATTERSNNNPVLSVSSDYDYEQLESCGASIMVFVKK